MQMQMHSLLCTHIMACITSGSGSPARARRRLAAAVSVGMRPSPEHPEEHILAVV